MSLAILSPLVILAQVFSKIKINFKFMLTGLFVFALLMAPYFLFEVRHGFQQTRAIIESFTTQKDYVPGTGRGLAKLDRVMQLVYKNTTNIFWTDAPIKMLITFYLLILAFVLLVWRKIISIPLGVIFALWQVLNILFFTFNSINVSEYYLNGMNVVWIAIFSIAIEQAFKKNILRSFAVIILGLFVCLNLHSFITMPVNRSGYIERKELVSFISEDAKAHGYPCVAVSYITSPGNDLGYRYFFWLAKLHVNQPVSGSPVYTIVYPTRNITGITKNFGVIGLILPEYGKYNKKAVDHSCSGADSNLTDPLFGYTE